MLGLREGCNAEPQWSLPVVLSHPATVEQTVSHLCHAHGCYTAVPPKMFMCKLHWFALPADLRDAIWREYRPGQEITKDPSPRYMAVQKLAVARSAFKPNDEKAAGVMAQYLFDAMQWQAAAIREGLGDPLLHLLEPAP